MENGHLHKQGQLCHIFLLKFLWQSNTPQQEYRKRKDHWKWQRRCQRFNALSHVQKAMLRFWCLLRLYKHFWSLKLRNKNKKLKFCM
jgi:hypothetical protein